MSNKLTSKQKGLNDMTKITKLCLVVAVMLCAAHAHAGSVSGSIRLDLNMTHTATSTLSTAFETLPVLVSDVYTTGSSTNQLNQVWYGRLTIPTNSWTTLDICGGITDSFGQVATMTRLRFFAVQAFSNNSDCIGVGGPVAAGVTSFLLATNNTVKLWPGETFSLTCPTATALTNVAGVSDVIGFTNFSASVGATCDVYILGSNP